MEEINLYDLLRFYIKKWLTIAIFVMIGGIVGIAYTYYIQTPQYESKATLLLVGTNRTAANQESVALNNYVELFKSRRVLEPVITDQGYDKGYDTLASGVTAQGVKGTDVINVSIKRLTRNRVSYCLKVQLNHSVTKLKSYMAIAASKSIRLMPPVHRSYRQTYAQ